MLKNKSVLLVIGALLIAVGLFAWPIISSDYGGNSNASGVPCLYSEVFHIHPHLSIFVDGKEEVVPAEIGISSGCTREIHTHDATGEIHIEAAKDRGYKFSDFLNVWGRSIERPGYALKTTVNGAETTDPEFVMKDKQQIILNYTKIQ